MYYINKIVELGQEMRGHMSLSSAFLWTSTGVTVLGMWLPGSVIV